MTNKEQVIIDGVDVSECEYVCNTAFGNIGCKLPFNEEIHCCNIPNCYFKQLARKTQEYEQLKEDYAELEHRHNEAFQDFERIKQKYEALELENQEGYEIVDELKHECERLKSYGDTLLADKNAMEIGRDDYMQRCKRLEHECEELKKQLEFVRTHRTVIDAEKDRYRKALEEIEEYIKEEEWSLLEYIIRDINNIINKAKGGNNENT